MDQYPFSYVLRLVNMKPVRIIFKTLLLLIIMREFGEQVIICYNLKCLKHLVYIFNKYLGEGYSITCGFDSCNSEFLEQSFHGPLENDSSIIINAIVKDLLFSSLE